MQVPQGREQRAHDRALSARCGPRGSKKRAFRDVGHRGDGDSWQGTKSELKEVLLQAGFTSPRCQEDQVQELKVKKKTVAWRGPADADGDPACGHAEGGKETTEGNPKHGGGEGTTQRGRSAVGDRGRLTPHVLNGQQEPVCLQDPESLLRSLKIYTCLTPGSTATLRIKLNSSKTRTSHSC